MRKLIAVAALLVLVLFFYTVASLFMARGVTEAERNEQEDSPSNYGLAWEDVEFLPRDDTLRLSGWYFQGEPDAPHLIFVHGLSSVRSGDGAVEMAALMVELGYGVLLFDLRGHGDSGGDQVSGGYYERRDVWGAYDYLVGQRGVADDRIGLVGFSMGAATAIMAAAVEPGIRAVVADSPYADVSDLIAQETARRTPFPEWILPVFAPMIKLMAELIYGIDIGSMSPEKAVTMLSYPVLVIHGEADERIPVDHGVRVAEAGADGTVLWRVADTEHVDAFKNHSEEYVSRVDDYFKSQIK